MSLRSKVTLRPRSKLERLLEIVGNRFATPLHPKNGILAQVALYYLLLAETPPAHAAQLLKSLSADAKFVKAKSLAEVEPNALFDGCPPSRVDEIIETLRRVGRVALETNLEVIASTDLDEARRALLTLPKLHPQAVDLLLLSAGEQSLVAPTASAMRVASRLGYPGADYASIARSLDAEVPEADILGVAWRAHHTLKQLGATLCEKERPQCDGCPLFRACAYHGEGADPANRTV